MSPRTSNRSSHALAAAVIGLAALFAGTPSFADTNAADTKAGQAPVGPVLPAPVPLPAPASSASPSSPVTLVPATPEFFTPPKRSSVPASEPPPESAPASGSGSRSGTRSGSNPASPSDTTPASPPAPDEDIRDIRGPKGMLPAWLIPALLAGVALLLIGGYAFWRWRRRRTRPRILLPFEVALQRLEEIRRLLDPASAREFSIAVSDIVRQYIEVQFMITATHRTTEEFLRDLLESSNASLAAHRSLLAEFLNQCDLAKFAGVSLSRLILESLHASARSFVTESSKPPPPPAAATRAPPPPRIKEARDSLPTT
jgi:hypothetical protein